jgi:hypothetical protein
VVEFKRVDLDDVDLLTSDKAELSNDDLIELQKKKKKVGAEG